MTGARHSPGLHPIWPRRRCTRRRDLRRQQSRQRSGGVPGSVPEDSSHRRVARRGTDALVRTSVTQSCTRSSCSVSEPRRPFWSDSHASSAATSAVAPWRPRHRRRHVDAAGAKGFFTAHRRCRPRRCDGGRRRRAHEVGSGGGDVGVAVPAKIHRAAAAVAVPACVDHRLPKAGLGEYRGLVDDVRAGRAGTMERRDRGPVRRGDVPRRERHAVAGLQSDVLVRQAEHVLGSRQVRGAARSLRRRPGRRP